MPCRTSPTSRCRSTRARRATRRWKRSSASPSRSRPRWPGFRISNTRVRSRATGCRRSRSSSRTAPTSTGRGNRSPNALQQAKEQLPAGIEPQMGPISTGLGEIYMWTVDAKPGAQKAGRHSLHADRSARDSGLGHQAATAQRARCRRGQHHRRLREAISRHARSRESSSPTASSFHDVMEALEKNNANVGAGYIERNGEQYLIRAPGQVRDIAEIAQHRRRRAAKACPCTSATSRRLGWARSCAPARPLHNGEEVVLGTTFMLMGENSRTVSQRGRRADEGGQPHVARGRRGARPSTTAPTWSTRRSKRCRRISLEGAVLVIAVLLRCSGTSAPRSSRPRSFRCRCSSPSPAWSTNKVSANLMSLGALDFGIIVDGAVIIVENCMRRLAEAQHATGACSTRGSASRRVAARRRK